MEIYKKRQNYFPPHREEYPRDVEPVEVVPDPSYAKGHSDGVAEEREAILANIRRMSGFWKIFLMI